MTTSPREHAEGYWIRTLKDGFQVVCPDGTVANDHTHTTKESAEKHKRMLEAFWPRG